MCLRPIKPRGLFGPDAELCLLAVPLCSGRQRGVESQLLRLCERSRSRDDRSHYDCPVVVRGTRIGNRRQSTSIRHVRAPALLRI